MSLAPERRRQLQQLGLRALVKRRYGEPAVAGARVVRFFGGVALVTTAVDGPPMAAVFADEPTGLGAAIDTAHREGAERLLFFAELNDGAVARRASQFRIDTTVIDPEGDMQAIAPAPPAPVSQPPDMTWAVVQFAEAGLDPVWEHGVLLGEWLGLEVARATPDQTFVELGVGKHDREANRLLHPDGPGPGDFAEARRTVAELRLGSARPHPINQLVPERWLRSVLVHHPDLVGLRGIDPAPPPAVRDDLRRRGVAPGIGDDGTIVVCSVGVDPDLVPQAADARLHLGADRRLMIVVPEGDDHQLTHRLAGLLQRPAEVTTVPATWRALLG